MDFCKELILVNKSSPIPRDYSVDLCNIKYSDKKVDCLIAIHLNSMLDDAHAVGYNIMVCSGYRSVEYQRGLFENKVNRLLESGMDKETAIKEAAKVVMPPGCSEHHTGLAVDIVSSRNSELDESQAETPENRWLRDNAYRYGFILRYPKGKEEITGVIYEPWHFRYVGSYIAKYMYIEGFTLEEFLSETLL